MKEQTLLISLSFEITISSMNKILIPALLCLGLIGLAFSYSKRSDCFSPDFARSDSSFFLGSDPLPNEIKEILNQPFQFLGSGNQAYAFESEDHQYVLKLFKFHCLKGLQSKTERLKQGLLVANQYSKNNSGLRYVHFPPTQAGKIDLRDKAGRKHSLVLDDFVFVIQEKAEVLGTVLKERLNRNDVEGAKEKLAATFQMIEEDLKQGIYDQDHNVIANLGFVGEKPIRIDFGKLSLNHEIDIPTELNKIAKERIIPWIRRFYPQFVQEIEQFLENNYLSSLYENIKENFYGADQFSQSYFS